jgi:hypothetical protein
MSCRVTLTHVLWQQFAISSNCRLMYREPLTFYHTVLRRDLIPSFRVLLTHFPPITIYLSPSSEANSSSASKRIPRIAWFQKFHYRAPRTPHPTCPNPGPHPFSWISVVILFSKFLNGSSGSGMDGGMEWIELAQNRDRWRALLKAVMKLWV